MSAEGNVWLRVRVGVVLTPIIEPVIVALEPWFASRQVKALVTSGLRSAPMQRDIILQYAVRNGVLSVEEARAIGELPTTATTTMSYDGHQRLVYAWQPAWSKLLSKGVIVNPPHRAVVLEHYLRDGADRKGQHINESPHFRGISFDIGGGSNGVADELIVVNAAYGSGQVPGLTSFLVERTNNCIHCDCAPVKPGGALPSNLGNAHASPG